MAPNKDPLGTAVLARLATPPTEPAAPAGQPEATVWRCFHCDETFAQESSAELHFGRSLLQAPACQIDVAEYRRMEETNRRHCEEDTDLHREIHRVESDKTEAVRRAEEAGYARGLADAKKHPEELGLTHATPQPEHYARLCEQFASDFTTKPPKNEFEHGVQTATARLAEAFRRCATPQPAEPAAAPQSGPNWQQVISNFIEDYEMRGEDEDGRDACYTPNENDKALLLDAINGLLSEPEFASLFAASQATEQPSKLVMKPEVLCHADGERCHGCAHYRGQAAVCEFAPDEQPADRAQRDEQAAVLCDRFAADFTTMPPKNPFEHGVQTACVRLAEAFRGGGLIRRAALQRKGD